MNTLVGILLLARDVAHREHWATESLSVHLALGEFYDSILDLTDKLVETYQGRDVDVKPEIVDDEPGGEIIGTLKRYQDWIEKNRYQAVPKEDTPIHNIIDEIVGQFLHTRYKLRKLK